LISNQSLQVATIATNDYRGNAVLVCLLLLVWESPRIAETNEEALQHAQHRPDAFGLQQQFLQAPANLFTLRGFQASAIRWAKHPEAFGQTGRLQFGT